MIALFVDQCADSEGGKSIKKCQRVKLQRRQVSVKHGNAEIFNIDVYRVEKKQTLKVTKARRIVENCGHIHKKHCKHAPKILYIAEKHEERGENKTDTDIEYDKADYRKDESKEAERKRHAVDYTKDKKDSEGKTEVYQRGD